MIGQNFLFQPANIKKILVISMPALGDALLSLPLVHSLKAAYPDAQIDMLVRQGSAAIVRHDPVLHQVLEFQTKSPVRDYWKMVKMIFRKYDLAVSTSTSDRATLCCVYAAPRRVSLNWADWKRGSWWKTKLLHGYCDLNNSIHTISQNLQLLEKLKIPLTKHFQIELKSNQTAEVFFYKPTLPYVILHCVSSKHEKDWNSESWRVVIEFFHQNNLEIILTGGTSNKELQFLEMIKTKTKVPIINCFGKLNFWQIQELCKNASLFVGVDTCTTHLAALTGTPLVALFGSSSVRKWSPWPKEFQGLNPFTGELPIEINQNVTVINANYLPDTTDNTDHLMDKITCDLVIKECQQRLIPNNL